MSMRSTSQSREIGNAIRSLRKLAGLTQLELADRIGMARTSITNIEIGKQTLTEPVINEIALALGYRVKIRFEKI